VSDVVAVALISAGSSLIGASVGALTTYKVSLRNTETTIATAEARKEVELAKVEAENERLRSTVREEERRNRQSTYHRFIDAFNRLFQNMGIPASEEEMIEIFAEYNHLLSGVLLFGPPSVRKGTYDLNDVYVEFMSLLAGKEEEQQEMPFDELWAETTVSAREQFGNCGNELVQLMHADVTRGVAEDP
jgi:hypothetical protein